MDYLKELVDDKSGIGAREAGSEQEQHTAAYLISAFKGMGYQVTEQTFKFSHGKQSKNIIVNSNSNKAKTIVLGAHYDSTAAKKGSLGATDNGAGVAAMLTIAKAIKQHTQTLDYNIRFIAFGAEEIGLQGSKYYVKQLAKQPGALANIAAMINFDTIAGGDLVYVHSAHTEPYDCSPQQTNYSSDTKVRTALLETSGKVLGKTQQYIIHPEYPNYPEGVTGPWSDHTPFACEGIAIAYVEATNFTIDGRDGFDGYSQSSHPALWDCFDQQKNSACDRATESKWGSIWHSEFDQLDKLEAIFPNRINQQITNHVKVLLEFFINAKHYLSIK